MRGTRIRAVQSELNGERIIDVVCGLMIRRNILRVHWNLLMYRAL